MFGLQEITQGLGLVFTAGLFFTAGFAGAVWDFKRTQRKKLVVTDALDEGVLEVKLEGVNEYLTTLAEARKHSYSDNDWSRDVY